MWRKYKNAGVTFAFNSGNTVRMDIAVHERVLQLNALNSFFFSLFRFVGRFFFFLLHRYAAIEGHNWRPGAAVEIRHSAVKRCCRNCAYDTRTNYCKLYWNGPGEGEGGKIILRKERIVCSTIIILLRFSPPGTIKYIFMYVTCDRARHVRPGDLHGRRWPVRLMDGDFFSSPPPPRKWSRTYL